MNLRHQCLCQLITNKNHQHNHCKNVITGTEQSSSSRSDQLLEVACLRVSFCPASCDGHKPARSITRACTLRNTHAHTCSQLKKSSCMFKMGYMIVECSRMLLTLAAVRHKMFTKIAPPVKCRRLAPWCNAAAV